MMKVAMHVVTGFLGSGKTKFIQQAFEEGIFDYKKKTAIILCEEGMSTFEPLEKITKDIKIYRVEEVSELNDALLTKIEQELHPKQVIVEYNGTWSLETLLKLNLPRSYRLGIFYYLLGEETYSLYMQNMQELLVRQIENCDVALITHEQISSHSAEKCRYIKEHLEGINPKIAVDSITSDFDWENLCLFEEEYFKRVKERHINFACLVMGLISLYLYIQLLGLLGKTQELQVLAKIRLYFFSILLDAVPFIIIGTLIAVLLQLYVDPQKLKGLLSRKYLSYPIAILSGVFLPLCDCAMLPVTTSLIKKGIPTTLAITFMLCAPIVNPITLVSTLYAFPNQPLVVVARVGIGILCATGVGMILGKITNPDNILKGYFIPSAAGSSGILEPNRYKGVIGHLERIFRQTGQELIKISGYVVLGALISAVIKSSHFVQQFMGMHNPLVTLVIIALAAMFISICANSNAFVARMFIGTIPLGYLIAFMVIGPMLDIKNLSLMRSQFKARFVICYIICVVGVTFTAFGILTRFF